MTSFFMGGLPLSSVSSQKNSQRRKKLRSALTIRLMSGIGATLIWTAGAMRYCWQIHSSPTSTRSSSSGLSKRRRLKPPGSLVYQALYFQRDDLSSREAGVGICQQYRTACALQKSISATKE